jgi:hypothetical protein
MKKKLFYLGGSVAVLALAAYIGLSFFLGSIVKAGVNRLGPRLMSTKVVLAGAELSPLSGSGTLHGLAVGNPAGWSDGNAFYLGKVHLVMKPFSVFGDHIVIDEITIDQPEFTYETKVIASNIGDLLKNLEQITGKDGGPSASAKNGNPIRFEVKKFVLRNGKVSLGIGAAALTLPMPPITLENLGTAEGGITPGQLTFAVMRSVSAGVVTASVQAAGRIGATGGAAAAEGVKKTGEAIKSLFGGKN